VGKKKHLKSGLEEGGGTGPDPLECSAAEEPTWVGRADVCQGRRLDEKEGRTERPRQEALGRVLEVREGEDVGKGKSAREGE